MKTKNFEPDVFDLEAWMIITNREVFFNYLKYKGSHPNYYDYMLSLWKKAGSPDIEQIVKDDIAKMES